MVAFHSLAFLATAFVVFLSSAAGVGGGVLLVPINLLILRLNVKAAVALSNFTIFCSSIANARFNFPRRHPLANRPLIDYALVLLLEPATLLGARFGGFLSKVLPPLVTTTLLATILTFVALITLRRAIISFRAETDAEDAMRQTTTDHDEYDHDHDEGDPPSGLEAPLLANSHGTTLSPPPPTKENDAPYRFEPSPSPIIHFHVSAIHSRSMHNWTPYSYLCRA